ncbi:hypothetical protein ACH5RR_007458 [Cinchona calisaya]|uniref:Disease resistance R13L4/SHOC-2-like LRR domain-containing protein n=1 Tax=Cinchona calisaya TaxID=153742 RepID=A0ABD3ASD3_9GENT
MGSSKGGGDEFEWDGEEEAWKGEMGFGGRMRRGPAFSELNVCFHMISNDRMKSLTFVLLMEIILTCKFIDSSFICLEKSVSKYIPPEKRITGHLRSLAFKVLDRYEGRISETMESEFSHFEMLRVLAIEGVYPRGYSDIFKLPEAFGKLIHLRYSSLRDSFFESLPSSLGNLQNLQTLELWDAKTYGLKNLGALSVEIHLESRYWKYHWTNVKFGTLASYIPQDILAGSKRSHWELAKDEAHFGSGLTSLRLWFSEIKEDPMKTLEMFPNLWSLDLHDCFVGNEMRCSGSGFRQLRSLHFGYLCKLVKWWIDEGAMPNLSSLTIWHCEKLEMIPIGLRSIATLKKLNINYMPKKFTDRIRVVDGQEGADYYKVSHIPSIIIQNDRLI